MRTLGWITAALVATALTPLSAHAQVLWSFGQSDGDLGNPSLGAAEFDGTGGHQDSVTVVVPPGGNGTTMPSFPGYFDDDPGCEGCMRQLDIEFTLDQSYQAGQLRLVYERYGSELDEVLLDGVPVATMSVAENYWANFAVSFRAMSPGEHQLTIRYLGDEDGGGNGHWIDRIRLRYDEQPLTSPGWGNLWRIGTRENSTSSAALATAEYISTGPFEDVFTYDVDDPTHDPDAPVFPHKLASPASGCAEGCARRVEIDFELAQAYARGQVDLHLTRYGSERDHVFIDGVKLGSFSGTEGRWIGARFGLPALALEPHTAAIEIVDGVGTVQGAYRHAFDFLRLVSQ